MCDNCDKRYDHKEQCKKVCRLHTVFIKEDKNTSFDNIFDTGDGIGTRKVTVFCDIVHLFPVIYGHVVTDMRRAASTVIVFGFGNAEFFQCGSALFVFRPCIEIADALSIMINLAKIGPFLFGVCRSI